MTGEREGDMSVWHVPQVPGPAFRVRVKSWAEADLMCKVLAAYDLFQYENRIKPDYCNAQGIEIWEDGQWVDFDEEDG